MRYVLFKVFIINQGFIMEIFYYLIFNYMNLYYYLHYFLPKHKIFLIKISN